MNRSMSTWLPTLRRASALAAVAGLVAFGASIVAAQALTPTTTWVPVHVCGAPKAGHAACDAMKLVAKTTTSATPARATPMTAVPAGPAGGYTPADLAAAYGVTVDSSAGARTVAIVDAYNNPNVIADLNTFDAHYGIPAETTTSFKVVNQSGAASPLPANNTGWATEESLDVQTVRGLCRLCNIVLVEATSNAWADLAAATDTAATTMNAKIVSNSYGGSEAGFASASSYDHKGVAIV